MKLSMWIIGNELAKKYGTIPVIAGGERNIESVRLLSGADIQSLAQNYVYIGSASDYWSGTLSVVLASGSDIMFVKHHDLTEVMNDLVVIFDKYREFEENLKAASKTDDPFQNMLNIIHELFKCPMFFGQKDLRIFALTKQYTDSEVYEGWDDIKKYYTMPIKLINSAVAPDMKKYPDSIRTVAIPVSENEKKYFSYQIRSNVYCGKELWGHLYIYYYNKAIPVSVLQLARYCADAYGALLDHLTVEDVSVRHREYTFLMDILDGKEVAREELENLPWQMGWDSGQKLRLYKLSFTEGTNSDVLFDFIFMTINNCQTPQIVFPYQKSIIVITKDTGKKLAEPFLTLQMVMQEDKYLCGVSFPFDNLQLITYAYFQASFSLDMERKNGRSGGSYIYYDDCAFTGLISYVRQNLEYKAFILPSLIELYELDRETGTEYYKTLFWLLANNCHNANTAKQLFIHRNTLKYRIDKIIQIMNVNIYDSNVSGYLRFCYSLMIDDYPIDKK
jgi:hypothetical protein